MELRHKVISTYDRNNYNGMKKPRKKEEKKKKQSDPNLREIHI